jgi:phosphoribosylformylglycinamidine synthase
MLAYGQEQVADLDMRFLHKGIPRRSLRGEWAAPGGTDLPDDFPAAACAEDLLRILAHPNVRSKEDVVRKYDHEVQGGTLIKPFVGLYSDGPSDGAVLRPLDAVDGWRGLALGCGFNPAYGDIDPYAMAIAAIDEAVRNVVCIGADPEHIAILDNFCWGNPTLPDRMGSLVRACKGCYDGARQYGTPFISGKDSLNNEYLDGKSGQQVAIPPSLLISAIGLVPDVRKTCTMDLKAPGNALYIVGETRRELGGSYYYRLHNTVGISVPQPIPFGPAAARGVHQLMTNGYIKSCHDCSEGGLALAIAEMSLAGGLGLEVNLVSIPTAADAVKADTWLLFSETIGRYVLEVAPEDAQHVEASLVGLPWARIGQVTTGDRLIINGLQSARIADLPVTALRQAFRGHLSGEVG